MWAGQPAARDRPIRYGVSSVVEEVTSDLADAAAHRHEEFASGRVHLDAAPPYVRQFMLGEADGPVPFHYPVEDYRTQMMDKEFE